jgi:ankyrin repeat protein
MDVDVRKAVDLFAAAQSGDVEQVRTLLPPYGDPVVDGPPAAPGGLTPLMIAAAGGHEAVVELLLRCGADPARRDARGHSAAFYARAAGHPDLADRLDTVVDQEKTIW